MYLTVRFFTTMALLLPPAILAIDPLRTLSQKEMIAISSTDPLETPKSDSLKVAGASPAYHCSDPSDDLFQITNLMFYPTHPRVGFYFLIAMWGHFTSATGDVPWLNITGAINGRKELGPMYYSPLCDLDVFQEVDVPYPDHSHDPRGMHRSCPPSIHPDYAVIQSPDMPLYPERVPLGEWELRAEAFTQDGRRIFCLEGTFNVTESR